MEFPKELRYTENDEWVRVKGEIAEIGITDHAQDQLSDIVYLEVHPSPGETMKEGEAFAAVESVKAAADVYAPVDGEVTEVNESLKDSPETINSDPYGAGWMVKLKLADASQVEKLMDAAAYQKHVEAQES